MHPSRRPLTAGERLRRKGQRPSPREAQAKAAIDNLIVIGASAGGQHALEEVFKRLNPDIPAALVVLMHSSGPTLGALSKWLARFTPIPIVTVSKTERLRQGAIFLAPGGRAIWLTDGFVNVEEAERERTFPLTTINRLFESAARTYGDLVIGVILSGLLMDGTAGLRAVHEAGGLTVVQDPQEAEYGDMPANAMRDLPVTFCLSLSDIGPALDLLARRKTRLETGMAVSVRAMEERIELLVRFIAQSKQNEGTHRFLVQELTALKQDLKLVERLVSLVPPTGRAGKEGRDRRHAERKKKRRVD
jgi:chemotaxis response regulator CheB